MSQSGILRVSDSALPPDVPTNFVADIGSGSPIANTFNILGTYVSSGTIPVSTVAIGDTLTLEVQLGQSAALSSASKAGLVSFDSASFSVDANGFVTFVGGSGAVTSVSGTPNRITSTGGTTPVIDIAATYIGQTSITTLGTIATGVWNGTAVDATHGGTNQTTYATGDILYASAINTLSKLTAGTNTNVLTLAGGVPTWAPPATSGTVTSVSVVSANGFAGSVATATTTPAITLSTTITGVLSGNGTSISGSAITQFDVLVGGASNAITSIGPGILGQILQSGGNAANPAYSTATYPSTATGTGTILRADGTNWVATTTTYPNTNAISTLLYASAANVMSALATANNGMLVTSATGVPSILAGPGTTGNILQSNAAAAPSFSTATYPSSAGTAGKVLISDGTNIVSSTPTFPNASASSGKFIRSDGTNWIASTPTLPTSAGTAGKILYSDATNYVESTPTFPTTASATSRKIIVSDGTNWVASTETYAIPGTSGNVMTSDGTNWISAAAPGVGLKTVTINLTNAQIKALNTTAVTILAPQGSGIMIVPVMISLKMIYGGTNVFTLNGNTTVCFGTTANTNPVASVAAGSGSNAFWNSNVSIYMLMSQQFFLLGFAATVTENAAISISTSSAVTGNAANNNTAKVQMLYYTITL